MAHDTVERTVAGEGANQSATQTCTDKAGNTSAPDTVEDINIDLTKPTIKFAERTEANTAGWNNGPVTVTWDCADELAGMAHDTVELTVAGEGANQSATQTCTDKAGNTSAPDTVEDINIDLTKPTLTGSASPTPNGAGWNRTAVTVTWTCTDDLSKVVAVSDPKTLSTDGFGQSATGACTDKAGNSVSETVKDINIDKTAPTVAWIGGPAEGSSYVFGSTSMPAAPTCSATDSPSGLDGSCTVTGYKTTPGTHTLTAVATDKAGNETKLTRSFTVQAWTLKGFYQPVDMNGVLNTVKGGSTVPLKFEVFAGSTELTDTSIVIFKVNEVTCGTGTVTDEIELTTTGGTSLRYSDGQFIQNWKTPTKPGSCYKVTMTTTDGSSITANFKLK